MRRIKGLQYLREQLKTVVVQRCLNDIKVGSGWCEFLTTHDHVEKRMTYKAHVPYSVAPMLAITVYSPNYVHPHAPSYILHIYMNILQLSCCLANLVLFEVLLRFHFTYCLGVRISMHIQCVYIMRTIQDNMSTQTTRRPVYKGTGQV